MLLAQVMHLGVCVIVPDVGENLRDLAADLRAAARRQGVHIRMNRNQQPGKLVVKHLVNPVAVREWEHTDAYARPPLYSTTGEDWRGPFLERLGSAISLAAACAAGDVPPKIAQAERAADTEFADVWDLAIARRRKPLADARQAQFLAALERTDTEWAACAEIGIRRPTLLSWQAHDPVFAAAREAAQSRKRAASAAHLQPVTMRTQEIQATREMHAARGDQILDQLIDRPPTGGYREYMDSGFYVIMPEGNDLGELAADLRAAAGRRGKFVQIDTTFPGRLLARLLSVYTEEQRDPVRSQARVIARAWERTDAYARPPLHCTTGEDWRGPFLERLGSAISLAAACAAADVPPEIAQAERAADTEFASAWDLAVAQRTLPLADERQARFLAALERTGTEWAAGTKVGIMSPTVLDWQAHDPVFVAAREVILRRLRAEDAARKRTYEERISPAYARRQMRAARGDRMLDQLIGTGFSEIEPDEGEDLRELAVDLRAAAQRHNVRIEITASRDGRLVMHIITS